jgi:hypothetical protein
MFAPAGEEPLGFFRKYRAGGMYFHLGFQVSPATSQELRLVDLVLNLKQSCYGSNDLKAAEL